jgi:ubiquinone/menaquinone biosynthesis C-methylase UbiE
LKQSIKDKEQRILVVGCGNSLLSEKMHKQMGFKKPIQSIDFEENVIKKMKNREVEGVEYHVMDAMHMTFDAASFDYAIDKGTLDALCADKSPETASKVLDYFNEIIRVLNTKGGTYIIVSLLQDFILDALITFFSKGIGNFHHDENIFEVRIQKIEKVAHKVNPDGSSLLPFFITIKRT